MNNRKARHGWFHASVMLKVFTSFAFACALIVVPSQAKADDVRILPSLTVGVMAGSVVSPKLALAVLAPISIGTYVTWSEVNVLLGVHAQYTATKPSASDRVEFVATLGHETENFGIVSLRAGPTLSTRGIPGGHLGVSFFDTRAFPLEISMHSTLESKPEIGLFAHVSIDFIGVLRMAVGGLMGLSRS
jgi:hypothetical protein